MFCVVIMLTPLNVLCCDNSAEDAETNYLYGPECEHESTFMVSHTHHMAHCFTGSRANHAHHLSLPSTPPPLLPSLLPLLQSGDHCDMGPGTSEPFPSTGTSVLSSLPHILGSYKDPMDNEVEGEEEEEDVRAYTMGPVLRVSRNCCVCSCSELSVHTPWDLFSG